MDIFEELGFDPVFIDQQLAAIKARYERDLQKPHYSDGVKAARKQRKALDKAVEKLEAALNNLSLVGDSICAEFEIEECPLDYFREGIRRMEMLEGPSVIVHTPGGKRIHKATGVKTGFILSVAKLYRDQTGKAPTVSNDFWKEKRSGPFVALLEVCADRIGADFTGLGRRAQDLCQEKKHKVFRDLI